MKTGIGYIYTRTKIPSLVRALLKYNHLGIKTLDEKEVMLIKEYEDMQYEEVTISNISTIRQSKMNFDEKT